MRKKQMLTSLSRLTEEGNGTLIPQNENDSSREPSRVTTDETDGAECGRTRKKRGRIRKRRKKSFRSSLEKILSMVIAPETVAEAVKSTPLGDNITYQDAILIAQVLKASNGDTQAAVYLRDTSGNKLKDGAVKDEMAGGFDEL